MKARRRGMTRKYVLTGGPGTGKSTLLAELQKRGVYAIKEVAEYLIEKELKGNGKILPWNNRERFQRNVLETQIIWEKEIPSEIKVSCSDRGIPDGIAFYRLDGIRPPEEIIGSAQNTDYKEIFILDPLSEYQKTRIRREDIRMAKRIHETLNEVYKELGYRPIRIYDESLEDRIERVLDIINL